MLGDRIEPLNFLLHYLEPQQKTFRSPYFNCPIDISKLFFILTGNNPIPHGSGEHRFEALKRRLIEIEFPDFTDDTRYIILREKFDELLNRYGITLTQPEKTRLIEISMRENGLGEGIKRLDDLILEIRLRRAQREQEIPQDYGPVHPRRPSTQSQNHPYA